MRNFLEERGAKLYFWRNEKMSSELMDFFPATLTASLSLTNPSCVLPRQGATVPRKNPNQDFVFLAKRFITQEHNGKKTAIGTCIHFILQIIKENKDQESHRSTKQFHHN